MNPDLRVPVSAESCYRRSWIPVLGMLGFALVILGPAPALALDCNRNGIADALEPDADGDGVPNACDNCRLTVNVSQTDSDEDGTGNRCDADLDNNGIIGLADYNVLRTCLASPETRCDLDEDGVVDASDVSVLGTFFGRAKERGRQPTQLVRGFVQTAPVDNLGAPIARVYLPNVRVYLHNTATGVDSYSVRTDLSGRFSLYAFVDGDYRICWHAEGFLSGCSETLDRFEQSVNPAQIGDIEIFEDTSDPNPTIFGQVKLDDGSDPRLLLPAIGLNQVAEVAVLDPDGNTLSRVYVNNFGNYYLPSVPTANPSHLTVFLGEDQISSLLVHPTAGLGFAQSQKKDLVISNRAPRVKTIVARIGGARARFAPPESVVSLGTAVDDPNGDSLTYQWWVDGNAGTLSSATGATTDWQLPSAAGFYTVHVLVRDPRGGHDQSTLNLRVTNDGVAFSGRVTDPSGTGISPARVEINGQGVATTTDGRFSIDVPDSDRFVFNIRAAGYALLSQIFDDGVTGGRWTLNPATVVTVDPTSLIQVTDQRSEENCPGPQSLRQSYADFPGIEEPVWQDAEGNVVAAFDTPPTDLPGPGSTSQRDCPPGISLSIPANSLEDADGNPPSGLVQITLNTVDLFSPQQMPGDYTVVASDGTERSMQSYGAGGVSIQAGGTPYNLKGGATAEVRIPVDPGQVAAGGPFPGTIPALYYDEVEGVWREEGTANLVGNDYVYSASHFSEINMDLVKDNQACVRVFSPPPFPTNYNLEIRVPNGTAAPTVKSVAIENTSPYVHVIYNLPITTNIVLVPIRTTGPDDPAPLGTFIVNTGAKQNPENPNLPTYGSDEEPYPACSTQVLFDDRALPDEEPEFLHGLLTFAASRTTEPGSFELNQDGSPTALKAELNAASLAYYAEIDPRDKRETLTEFYNENRFGQAGGTEASTVFANAGDLGFGREMHCRRDGEDAACYVTNYGYINTPDLADLGKANSQTDAIATVAMEYSRIESKPAEPGEPEPDEFDDPERVVKFYVYAGGYDLVAPTNPLNPGPGGLLVEADLDNRGDRPIPQLCMVCHGGHYPSLIETDTDGIPVPPTNPSDPGAPPFSDREDVKLGSQFLPFDLSLYTFLNDTDKDAQQAEFKVMNEIVSHVASKLVDDPPVASNPEIVTVISEMYSGIDPSVQEEGFVVPDWTGSALQEQMYTDVLAPSCRTCHLAHSGSTSGFPGLRFGSHNEFVGRLGKAEARTCKPQFVMPHAKVTHTLFWESVGPHQPAIFQLYGDGFAANGWLGTKCNDFTAGGDEIVTTYQTDIQSIYDDHCAYCHTDGGDAGGLNLRLDSATSSYETTVGPGGSGVNSQQAPGLKLVNPGNPGNSYLLQKLKNTQGNGTLQMPKSAPALDPGLITIIEDWIGAGASAN